MSDAPRKPLTDDDLKALIYMYRTRATNKEHGFPATVLDALLDLQSRRASHEPEVARLRGILSGIGECISGHDDHLANDIDALLAEARDPERVECSSQPPPAVPPTCDFDRDLAAVNAIRNGYEVSDSNRILLGFIDNLWSEYSLAQRKLDKAADLVATLTTQRNVARSEVAEALSPGVGECRCGHCETLFAKHEWQDVKVDPAVEVCCRCGDARPTATKIQEQP